jgi:ketosteroid isomerase-like protein
MSQENVEIIRASWRAWERGDVDALLAVCDPAIVWDQSRYVTGEFDRVYRGYDGIRQFLAEWLAPFENYYAHAEEFTDAGEAVVVRARQGGRGAQSGAAVESPPYWCVAWLQGGLIARIEFYRSDVEALEALGLDGDLDSRDSR